MSKRNRKQDRYSHNTLGALISTMVFVGMAVWLFLEALSLAELAPPLQVGGLFFSSFLCFLGALRLVIAKAWYQHRKGGDR